MYCRQLFAFVLLIFVSCSLAASVFKSRNLLSEEVSTTAAPRELCQNSTPCGWAVYHRFTRDIEYFLKNNCECTGNKKCRQTDDDISISAYVYRCRENPDGS